MLLLAGPESVECSGAAGGVAGTDGAGAGQPGPGARSTTAPALRGTGCAAASASGDGGTSPGHRWSLLARAAGRSATGVAAGGERARAVYRSEKYIVPALGTGVGASGKTSCGVGAGAVLDRAKEESAWSRVAGGSLAG